MMESSTNRAAVAHSSIDRSISELFDVVWSRKWLIASCVAGAVLLGVLYLVYAQPVYAVRARVLVQPQRSPLTNGAENRQDKEFLATQAEIISSPAVIDRVLPLVTSQSEMTPELDPLLAVLEKLAVDPVTGTNVLSLSYDCLVPSEGIATVKGILDSYQRFLQELNDDSRLESLHLLTRSEEKLRGELEDRETAYLELRKQSPFVGQDRDANSFQQTLLQNLAEALTEARQHRIDLENRMGFLGQSSNFASSKAPVSHAVMKVAAPHVNVDGNLAVHASNRVEVVPVVARVEFPSFNDAPADAIALMTDPITSAGMGTTPEFELISRELLSAEMRERELAQHCGPKHPDLRAVKEQITSCKQRLQHLAEQAPATLHRELVVAQTRENQLLELYDQELQQAKANDDFLIKESLELDGIERLKSIHNSIVAQLNDWQLVEPSEDGGMGVNVVVLESPTIGMGPVWPKKSLLLSLCAATGMLVGLGIVVVTKS